MATYSTSERTRDALIEATGELAAERGFPSVSTRAIAERAGENVSSIRYHFGGKDRLYEEVIRRVTRDHVDNPISEILEAPETRLDTPEGQSRVLTEIVRRFISVFFRPENPWWYSNVAYQALQSRTPLHKLIKREVIDPYFGTVKTLVRAVKPRFTDEQVLLYARIIQGSLVIHTHNIEQGLVRDEQKYSPEYLKQLEAITIRQNLLLLGLPVE